MGKDEYQAPGPVTAALSALTVTAVTADGVALAYNQCADAETLHTIIDLVGAIPCGTVRVGDHETTLTTVDRRGLSAQEWINSIPILSGAATARTPERSRLDRASLEGAARHALRDLHRPDRLAKNLLAMSALVGASTDPARDLHRVITEAMATVTEQPGRALRAAYQAEGRSHEAAAETLGLPYSTFRRHLARGVDILVELLWRREGAPRSRSLAR